MTIDLVTFGCRLNTYESEVIRKNAADAGLDDVVIVNTCAVTAEAVRQARQTIRRLKRDRPEAKIVVTGCAAQTDPSMFVAMPEVDRVLGNHEKMIAEPWKETRDIFARTRETPAAIADTAASATISAESAPAAIALLPGEAKAAVNDIFSVRETALHLIEGLEGRARAFVQVQNGCDHRCTFCIIPYGRGASRSVAMGEVVAQIRRLTENGYAEVVLTGVDMTSWGQGLPGAPKLGTLVRQVLKHVPELKRLRLSSIDSIEADHDLLDCFANDARLMPHLHLSLQAGDDMVLKRMKRRHLRADAIAFCQQVRRLRPDTVFGGDIIAGFPTETEEMFARSLDLVDDCGLTFLHVFPFSPRPGTPASKMPQVRREVVKERARRLRAKGEAALGAHLDAEVGASRQVLVETVDEKGAIGRSEHFTPVKFAPGDAALAPGLIVTAVIAGHDGKVLVVGGSQAVRRVG